MAGIDRNTGKMLVGWPNVFHKLVTLYTMRIGSRLTRRLVGSAVPATLGRNLTPSTILRLKTALIVATELWEPRYKILRIGTIAGEDTVEGIRMGGLSLQIVGEYRPRGNKGDTTTDVVEQQITVGTTQSGQLEYT